MKIKRESQPAQAGHGSTGAWWYENRRSIDVVVESEKGDTVICRIHRRYLADWVKRTEPAK